jgi:hypothetical protein
VKTAPERKGGRIFWREIGKARRGMSYAPLLDDPEFLAELDKLDVVAAPHRDPRFVEYVRPTLDEWARGEEWDLPDYTPAPERPVRRGRLVAAVAMLGGTLAGALLATAVFHEQVIRILDALRQ